MAQVDSQNNPNDPNNPNNVPGNVPNQPGQQQTNQPATSSGAGAVTPTGAANVTGQVTGTATPSQPFQNISAYLAANAPQSEALAGQIASNVANPITQAQQDVQNAATGFQQSVNKGYTPEDQNVISGVSSNPVQAAATPEQVAAFQAQLNDAYTGPTDFTTTPEYANLQTEIANAQALGSQAQTPTGIQTLLQGVEGPTTAGVNNLDTLLLAQNPENFATISAAGAPATNENNTLGTALTNAATTGNAAAQTGLTSAQQAAKDAAAAFQGASGNFTSSLDQELANAMSQYENAANLTGSTVSAIDTGTPLTAQQAAYANIDPAAYSNLLNLIGNYESDYTTTPVTPSQYLTAGTVGSAPSLATAATPQDYATAAALAQLGGTNFTNPLANPNPSVAGTALSGTTPTTFDLNKALSDLSNTFSAKDLNYVLNANAGPNDALKAIEYNGITPTNVPYGPAVQQAAQTMLGFLNRMGPGYYPGVNKQYVDAVTRMAAGQGSY